MAAHVFAKLNQKYLANGWSLPYLFSIGFSTIFYVLIGFYLLIQTLSKYFSRGVTVLVVLTIAFATNLFFHSTFVTMAHGFLFFDYCLLIYLTVKFYESPAFQKAIGIGATIGLIAMTRVPEIISVFIPLLWGIHNWGSLKARFHFFKKNYRYLLYAAGGFVIVFSLQLFYWYYVSGHLIFNPYEGETFDFLKSKILKGWFHYSNGWLIYTPVMAFSLLGWFLLRKYFKAPQLAIFIFVGLHTYIHYSYYAWTYFPGLGSRPMVETYPILSFGLAAFFQCCTERKWLKWLPISILIVFSWLNLFQSWQIKKGIIWTERGNAAFYWETFGTLTSTKNSLRAFDSKIPQPDTSDLVFLQMLASESFEDPSKFSVSSEIKHSGNYALFDDREKSDWQKEILLNDVKPKDWVQIGIFAYSREQDKFWSRDLCANLVVELYDEKQISRKWTHIKISSHIGNDHYSIWSAGNTDEWGEASFFIQMPSKMKPGWKIKIYIWNPHRQKLFLDDFFIKHYR